MLENNKLTGVIIESMNLIRGVFEMTVLAVFSVLFAGYALFIYPFEKLSEITNPEVREKKLKYAPASS
ncbi:hypothetical protein Q7A53_00070 [Halobacillus rhizosphaerae]|uniref:hypothetical protein n=1 Tax=Halobacillus rhizosphaerae TaxID=3064889 RepID=UPI00398B1936